MYGIRGSVSGPIPAISTRAVSVPCVVSSCHRRSSSSQVADSTAHFRRTCGRMPNRSAHRRRYAQISGWLE